MHSKYPTTYYRVSIKAIIRNTAGQVLVVKENGSNWSLPGGGMDHGETVHEALVRELYEEALISAPFSERIVGTEILYMEKKEAWLLWLVYEITIDQFQFGVGEDADEVSFMDPAAFKQSESLTERLVHKYASIAPELQTS